MYKSKRESVYEPILRDAETLGRAEYLTIRAGGDAEDGKTLPMDLQAFLEPYSAGKAGMVMSGSDNF